MDNQKSQITYTLTVLFIFFSFFTNAQIAEQKVVDSIFSKWDNANSPGCGLGIIKEGKLVYARGYGMANLEHGISNSSSTVFRIGSTSKQFTAACIVLLEQQGKLKLDNTLNSYFPKFPAYAKKITVRHLLNHTSGIRDYLTLAGLKGMGPDVYYDDSDIMSWLTNQDQLNFDPGEEFLYSNSGYWLLGQIVNKVAGMNMAAYAKKEIFNPLKMTHTQFYTDHTKIVKDRAAGYSPNRDGGFSIDMTTLGMIGDGGILTSINDIKLWDEAFYSSKTLTKEFWRKMTEPGKLNNGEVLDYACGLMVHKRKGLDVIEHGGAFVGYRANIIRFPDQRFTVAVFANRSDANPSRLGNKVADVFLKQFYKKTIQKKKKVSTIKETKTLTLEQMTGNYELQAGIVFEIKKISDSLQVTQKWNGAKYFLKQTQGNTFEVSGQNSILFTFSDLQKDKSQKATILQGGRDQVCKRVKTLDLSKMNMKDYIGEYYSKELDIIYEMILDEKGQLRLRIKNEEPMLATAIDKDKFSISGLIFKFERKEELVSKFSMEAGRVKNLEFIKK